MENLSSVPMPVLPSKNQPAKGIDQDTDLQQPTTATVLLLEVNL